MKKCTSAQAEARARLSRAGAASVPCWHSGRVQDRYASDLGDYLKFGLLRRLAPPGGLASPRLGVVWYRSADETHNADGKHITYLDPEATVG